MVVPWPTLTAAGEFAFLSFRYTEVVLRFGFYGLLEIESEAQTRGTRDGLFPLGDIAYWRGAYGVHASKSLDAAFRRVCRRCLFEFALLYRHESEYYTGSNSGGEGRDVSEVAQVGDLFMPDIAFRNLNND